MGNSYVSSYHHLVYSVKNREHVISPEWRERAWAYLGGIARENDFKALEIGGTANHVHLLVSLPSTLAIAKVLQLLKGGSSKWINEEIKPSRRFEWQEGYGAFSIGVSQIEATREYIRTQEEHHRGKTFEEEFRAFLMKHGIEYDERYIWG
jgi:putative transposase